MRFWVIAGVFAIIGVFLAVQGGVTKTSSLSPASSASADALLLRRMPNTAQSATPASLNKLEAKTGRRGDAEA